jgi:drug/metabolite transporter (DMT)-like permease
VIGVNNSVDRHYLRDYDGPLLFPVVIGASLTARSLPPSRAAIWGALGAVYIIWGSTYLAIRFVVETIPPFISAGTRFLVAGVVMYAVRRAMGDAAPTRIEWRSAAIIGVALLLGGNGGVVWAEQQVPSGLASLMIATTPLWIVLLDYVRPWNWFVKTESKFARPQPRALLGVLIGFGGVLLLVNNAGGRGDALDPTGALVLVFATFSWASGSLYGRGARLPASPLLGTGMEMLAGGAALMLLGTLAGEWGRLDLSGITTQSVLALVYLIVFGSWGGFSAYVWLLRNAPTPLVATYAYVNPIVAIVLGSLFADERITPRVILAAAVILGAVVLTTTARVVRGDPTANSPRDEDVPARSEREKQ